MQMNGETIIAASPEVVWKALNDPAILKQAIPGCESMEKVSDTEFKATVATKIGPMQTRFAGAVTLSDIDPPRSYKITGSGSGGLAGSAKGGATVRLEPVPEGTKLLWTAESHVTGKIAQLGSRLIDSVAKAMAKQFFAKFSEAVAPKPVEAGAAPSERRRLPAWVWIVLAAAIAGLLYAILRG
jgi:hypothetical protein